MVELHFWSCAAWLLFSFFPINGEMEFCPRRCYFFNDALNWRLFEVHENKERIEKYRSILLERDLNSSRTLSVTMLRPVYKLFFADIDRDGRPEIIAGIERAINGRRYRRVYVYSTQNGLIKAKWLGSRLSFVMEDFHVEYRKKLAVIVAREKKFGKLHEGVYVWYHFGFRTISLKEVTKF
ncbi:MAG: hypothetical protein HQM10_17435 [Candidatus Riflebacteria bacterium]|nr:hypothetical protein [Candidatus Riflebacteria bacterium]